MSVSKKKKQRRVFLFFFSTNIAAAHILSTFQPLSALRSPLAALRSPLAARRRRTTLAYLPDIAYKALLRGVKVYPGQRIEEHRLRFSVGPTVSRYTSISDLILSYASKKVRRRIRFGATLQMDSRSVTTSNAEADWKNARFNELLKLQEKLCKVSGNEEVYNELADCPLSMSDPIWRKNPSDASLEELVEQEQMQASYMRERFRLMQNRIEHSDRTKKNMPVWKPRKQLHSRSIKKKKKVGKEKVQKAEDGPCVWTAPRSGYVKLDVFGSKSGGYGFTIRDCDAKLIAAVSGVPKPESLPLLYCQLQGVEKGLQHALSLGFSKVKVTIHSLYAVMVAAGSHNVGPMDCHMEVFSTIEQIKKLKSRFEHFYIDHCPSQSNRAAKYLSKLHKEAYFCRVEEMPSELGDIIEEDARKCVTDAVLAGRSFLPRTRRLS